MKIGEELKVYCSGYGSSFFARLFGGCNFSNEETAKIIEIGERFSDLSKQDVEQTVKEITEIIEK